MYYAIYKMPCDYQQNNLWYMHESLVRKETVSKSIGIF